MVPHHRQTLLLHSRVITSHKHSLILPMGTGTGIPRALLSRITMEGCARAGAGLGGVTSCLGEHQRVRVFRGVMFEVSLKRKMAGAGVNQNSRGWRQAGDQGEFCCLDQQAGRICGGRCRVGLVQREFGLGIRPC